MLKGHVVSSPLPPIPSMGLPLWFRGKESACGAGDVGGCVFDPWADFTLAAPKPTLPFFSYVDIYQIMITSSPTMLGSNSKLYQYAL